LDAKTRLGQLLMMGSGITADIDEGVRLIEAAAKGGQAEAQLQVAVMNLRGIAVTRNLARAREMAQKAADQRSPEACCFYGTLLLNGIGGTKDEQSAANYMTIAAEAGYGEAEFLLGWMYEKGRGVEINLETAREWYRKAAAKQHSLATKSLKRIGE
jgi:TPR repeat protein